MSFPSHDAVTMRSAVLSVLLVTLVGAPAAGEPVAVAVVVSVVADATLHGAAGTPRAVQRFDRLAAGTWIETSPRAEVVVVFRSGTRARVKGSSRVRIDDGRAVAVAGELEALAAVPALPIVAPVADAGTTVAAVRVRAGTLTVRAPAPRQVTLADATVLAADATTADAYEVEVEDADARIVFRTRTAMPRIHLPPGALDAGRAYRWRVRARAPSGYASEGQGHITTLAADAVEARAALHGAPQSGDPSWTAFLAELDFALGLWTEALDGFRQARDAGLDDAVVDGRIADLEMRVGSPPPLPR